MKKCLFDLKSGEHFVLDGVEFVKLDDVLYDGEGDTLVITADVLPENIAFEACGAERIDHNNFIGSNIQKYIENWIGDHPEIAKATRTRLPIDLTSMDGMTTYGTPETRARILTIDEYRRFRKHIPLTSDWYWLATPWCTPESPSNISSNYNAYYVRTDGSVSSYDVYYANYCPRPALTLASTISVEVEDDDENHLVLKHFSTSELIDEIVSRTFNKMLFATTDAKEGED